MTRGLLSQVPVLFGLDPAIVTETECSARGGRRCLYAVSWEEGGPDQDHRFRSAAPAVDAHGNPIRTGRSRIDAAGRHNDGPVGGERRDIPPTPTAN